MPLFRSGKIPSVDNEHVLIKVIITLICPLLLPDILLTSLAKKGFTLLYYLIQILHLVEFDELIVLYIHPGSSKNEITSTLNII